MSNHQCRVLMQPTSHSTTAESLTLTPAGTPQAPPVRTGRKMTVLRRAPGPRRDINNQILLRSAYNVTSQCGEDGIIEKVRYTPTLVAYVP
jgi:hypothetical protein